MENKVVVGVLNTCCQLEENLGEPQPAPGQGKGATVTFRVCRVCNKRHFRMTADTGHLGLRILGLG